MNKNSFHLRITWAGKADEVNSSIALRVKFSGNFILEASDIVVCCKIVITLRRS
jgi:hypothetical protein